MFGWWAGYYDYVIDQSISQHIVGNVRTTCRECSYNVSGMFVPRVGNVRTTCRECSYHVSGMFVPRVGNVCTTCRECSYHVSGMSVPLVGLSMSQVVFPHEIQD